MRNTKAFRFLAQAHHSEKLKSDLGFVPDESKLLGWEKHVDGHRQTLPLPLLSRSCSPSLVYVLTPRGLTLSLFSPLATNKSFLDEKHMPGCSESCPGLPRFLSLSLSLSLSHTHLHNHF
ncbi:hypothetical protein MN608_07182 [Microdochium nivale]|nr:hypothetical protein MN608_07182 [Microdochium nivale]